MSFTNILPAKFQILQSSYMYVKHLSYVHIGKFAKDFVAKTLKYRTASFYCEH